MRKKKTSSRGLKPVVSNTAREYKKIITEKRKEKKRKRNENKGKNQGRFTPQLKLRVLSADLKRDASRTE